MIYKFSLGVKEQSLTHHLTFGWLIDWLDKLQLSVFLISFYMNNRFIIDLWNLCHITNILNQTLLIDILGYCACQIYQYQMVQGVLDTTLCEVCYV
jgi:hypothetical protein